MKTSLTHPKKSPSSKARPKPERGCVRSTSRSTSKRRTVSGLIGRSRVHSPAAAGATHTAAPRPYHLYPRHKHFHKMLNRPGNKGRNNLYMYMRHWTAGWLKRERYTLFKRLPWSYAQGQRLPVTTPGVPKNYPDANKLVTEDCIRPMAH